MITALAVLGSCKAQTPFEREDETLARIERRVPQVMKPQDRADQATALLKSWIEHNKELESIQEEFDKRLGALNADPKATRAQFDAMFDELDQRRAAVRDKILDTRDALVALATADEWRQLGGRVR